MRRRRAGAAISLFAFQDIITSVSGIIIVIVLLLTLELVERPEGESGSPAQAAELRAALAGAEADIEQLKSRTGTTDDLIREVAQWSPAELERQIAERKLVNAELARQLEALDQKGETLAADEQAVQAERFDAQDMLDELEQTRRRNAELEQQLAAEREDDRPLYSLPRGSESDGWIVVCANDRVTAARIGQAERPRTFTGKGGGLFSFDSAADRFLEWARGPDVGGSAYFLVLVRPSGIGTFDEIQAAFEIRGTRYGFDPVAADQSILHPERGAAP